ncbi:hypothetical protein BO82DRAFT_289539 [Aspergillus uvarum CBS 121591]|uniref:Synaptobrevin n=1 Tax=Aspergillus uvarum CBS 121591 TaxID=1448315 RepID=A0A319C4P8_9EURO|nr:hypothetical protein BO82DRAFT_289539 [Aspergillus uvarum CBS 121591]PYH79131.1 hypothetical protein BO82DRAFT_289539 [Aspergillus uvarum CBS 121591]
MTLTTYDTSRDSSELAALNLSRLLARLEYNLLSSAADLRPLRQSDYQRKRVGANIEYARTTLQNLERTLPQIKPLEHRQTLQTNLAQQRLVLGRLQDFLDQITAEAETSRGRKQQRQAVAGFSTGTPASGTPNEEIEEDSDSDSEPPDGEDLLGTPEEGSTTDEVVDEDRDNDTVGDQQQPPPTQSSALSTPTTTETESPLPTTTTTTPAPAPAPPTATTTQPHPSSTLRIRTTATTPQSPSTSTLTATGTSLHPESHPSHPSSSSPPNPNPPVTTTATTTEETLISSRAEQEDLTTSLLSLASQLKSSSQAFHASLDAEKSVLARAVDGLDRTTTSMESAERRMGALRRMSEGKGWWGRMMLYAWIFGLWIVAILIVYVGPKLRF